MSEGIAALEKEDASMEANKEGPWQEHDEDVKTINKLKTKKQRRKELKLKREDRKIKKDKQEKLKEQDVFRLKSMNKEISAEEKRISQNIAKRNERKEIKKGLPDSITGYKFEEQDLDLKLSDELTGNLNSLKPEGNLLIDRYKSMQKRNIVETRVKQKIVKNRKKRKLAEKRTYKMGFDWETK